MAELLEMYTKAERLNDKLVELSEEFVQQLRVKLWGESARTSEPRAPAAPALASPRQTTKRIKRLSSLKEDEGEGTGSSPKLPNKSDPIHTSKRIGNSQLLAAAATTDDKEPTLHQQPSDVEHESEAIPAAPTLMLPPAPPLSGPDATVEHSFARPQRAAKLKSEKNLKEPKLNQKMRRPSNFDTNIVKLEHEQRQSQMHQLSTLSQDSSKPSLASIGSGDSVLLVPGKAPSIVDMLGDESISKEGEGSKKSSISGTAAGDNGTRNVRVRIKREKSSLSNESKGESTFATPAVVPKPKVLAVKNESISFESAVGPSITLSTSIITTSSSVSAASATKKTRKKKDLMPKPIKVERFSEIEDTLSPVASRTRHGSFGRGQPQQEQDKDKQQEQRATSIYEDAVETLPTKLQAAVEDLAKTSTSVAEVPVEVAAAVPDNGVNHNEVIAVGNANATVLLGDTTFYTNPAQTTFQVAPEQGTFVVHNQNPNSTVTLTKMADSVCGIDVGDVTFNVPLGDVADKDEAQQPSFASSKQSMETAKDTSQPQIDTLITEEACSELPMLKAPISKLPTSAKAYRMPTRTNELFNPLVQSPVKMKVKAFENVVNTVNSEQKKPGRPKRPKENAVPVTAQSQTSLCTPSIGKMPPPALGRFLTPTLTTNILPNALALVKKGPNSASKAVPFPKSIVSCATNLRSTNSSSNKTISRENSADDFRKGLHLMAEERKKQREQKHLLAAQQREAKDRERAERMAKLAKEREDKRLKKQMEADQRKRELEEIQRKLRQQDEAAAEANAKAAKTKAIIDQEHQMLQQVKQQSASAKTRMMPPPPKLQSKYTFEMLHEDDSTDEESKTSYKRPPPPTWSRSHVRGEFILRQQYWPTDIIDSFFSVQPMTPDLKLIFPNIDERHLKRNSSVMWSTPPRYSELPKY